jgi:hypothetical protein
MDEMLGRAFRAYFMAASRAQYVADAPSESKSGQEEVGGKQYIVLRNGGGILATYRVRNNGVLKRLVRWPSDLGTTSEGKCSADWRYQSAT